MASKEELKETFVSGAVPTEEDFHNLIDVAGEQGEQGVKGDKGDKGDTGEAGFPTQEQWNALVARVEELENPSGE